jgi:hypothetical protein
VPGFFLYLCAEVHASEFISQEDGGTVDKVILLGGIAGTIGGFAVIFYQALTYLQTDVWNSFSLFTAVNRGPASLADMVSASPGLMDTLGKCPLSAALIAAGLALLWIAGKLRNRYA